MSDANLKIGYRPEIDGLRAFAITAVIINHFNKDIFPNGYLGVDIFFVLSGYVICSSISRRKSKNLKEFIISFFERRIKRLIPGLVFFVLVVSFLICLFSPNSVGQINTGISALFGFSNIALFLKSKDYFSELMTLNPFTHTWSLGVEEQFYLILPLLAWFSGFAKGGKNSEKVFFFIMVSISIISLFLFANIYSTNQPAAYFLMPMRIWEMGAGCITFLIINKKTFYEKKSSLFKPLILILLILIIMLNNFDPVFSTIGIVFLASCLLIVLQKGTFLFKVFTNKIVVHIGLLSYSLYLWHWGILSISKWTVGIYWWTIPFQTLLIILVSIASYRYIEQPFRTKKIFSNGLKSILEGLLITIFSTLFLFVLNKPLRGKLYLGDRTNNQLKKPYFEDGSIKTEDCIDWDNDKANIKEVIKNCSTFKIGSKQKLWFIGDSHTYLMWLGAEYIANETNSDVSVLNIVGTPFPAIDFFRISNPRVQRVRYELFKSLEKEILSKAKRNDIIFITLRMPYHFGVDWYQGKYTEFYKLKTNKKISKKDYFDQWLFLVGKFAEKLEKKEVSIVISYPIPEFPYALTKQCKEQNPNWFNKFSRKECSYPISFFNSEGGKYKNIINKLDKLSNEHKNIYQFDSLGALCKNGECNYSINGKRLYRDDDHISNYASRYILSPQIIKLINDNSLIP